MGETKPRNVSTASNDDSDELRNIVIAAMTDEHVISTIADRVANVISAKFEKKTIQRVRTQPGRERQEDRRTRGER